jgi:dolichol-phosphate mannosyltransferase/undecaprenyl-phosphate 4-deoxy-4-formamido-L-arabinose transferase
MQVSLIVPVFNAEATLRPLFERIAGVSLQSDLEFEIVFVDDASTDGSLAVLRGIKDGSANVVVIANPVSRGQAEATLTGIAAAGNELVVTLDDDLKHRPEDIPRLLALLDGAGPDSLVMGIFAGGHRALWRIMAGIGSNAISNLFLDKPLPLRMTTFCAFRKHLCSGFHRDRGQRLALITELVQAADRTLTVRLLSGSGRMPSRYTFASLFRLFMSRSNSYRLTRVLLALAFCWLVTLAATGLLLQSQSYGSPILGALWLVSAAPSLLLTMLVIRMLRHGSGASRRRNRPD